jgi:hypothetical protein
MKITKDAAHAAIEQFVRQFGKMPTRYDFKYMGLPSAQTLRKLVGNFKDLTILKDVYNESPNICPCCGVAISFEQRNKSVFCSKSCSAKHNNTIRGNKNRESWLTDAKCICCEKQLTNRYSKYCSSKCQHDYQYNLKKDNWLATGCKEPNRFLRMVLTEEQGNNCSVCGIEEHNGKPIVFEVEHINGNSEDCSYENVCLICPNCHSQTDTYKGKNRGKGRYSRSQRYRDGKSY